MAKIKLVPLREAVEVIRDGDVLFLGSLIESRRPMAAAYEIVRQGKKGLILLAECSLAEDILVGYGCAVAWRGCYTGMANFGLSPATLRKIETGEFIADDIGHIDIILGAMAAMAGSPFVATRATLGSDVLNPDYSRVGQIRKLARDPDMIPREKFILFEDPFYGEGQVKLQPAMKADVAIIHVQQAGEEGTARVEGPLAFDHYFIHAARRVILTAEQVVPEEYLRRDPNRNQIPCTSVDMVVEIPWGGHPSQVQGFYDVDMAFIRDYVKMAKSESGFQQWVDEWVLNIESHDSYLDKLVAINMDLEVDLMGQLGAETIDFRLIGAVGGQLDFVIGAAWAKGGRAINVLPSTRTLRSGEVVSTVVPWLSPGAHVTVPHHFVQFVVTEYGIADLWLKSRRERAEAIIAIAHPDFRDELKKEAKRLLY